MAEPLTKKEAEAYLQELEALCGLSPVQDPKTRKFSPAKTDPAGRTLPLQHVPELHEGEVAAADPEMRFCPGCRAVTLLHRLGSIIFDHATVIEAEIEKRGPGLKARAAEVERLAHDKQALARQVESVPELRLQVEQQREYIERLEQKIAIYEAGLDTPVEVETEA